MGLNQGWTYREQVPPSAVGQTVLQYYSARYRHSNEESWRKKIISGQISLDGRRVDAETILQLGQKLAYHRLPWLEPTVPLDFEVIYEDPDLLAIAKPAGLPVLPGGGFLQNTLLWQIKKIYPQNTPVPIHRLGRGTSGLLLLAKSALGKSSLSRQMRSNSTHQTTQSANPRIQKIYLAKVDRVVPRDRFTITNPIGKIPHPHIGYVYGATPTGKFAHSECQVIKRNPDSTIIQVAILTGRPHQIRIHLAAAGFPLMGDPLYGVGGIPQMKQDEVAVPGDCGYHLHAHRLAFTHPTSNERVNLICPPPVSLT
ncbi:pseudouridine synthase, RluA family [Xenococcus sp. PCC 7305]|uniref:RluA family pseudouridine synthase n=1 Tax=Xenococcus sp. PCC 7305 TaxID=102125 RepID=UPI0002AC7D21|nr:RluA family pseudouridine synthase [Xenococcus sp. PCC 7305]ELS00308.1 pseudouridine synthase, RluA family [Xenococcus sp. PCC 7305]